MGTEKREKIKQIRHKQIDVPVPEDIGTLLGIQTNTLFNLNTISNRNTTTSYHHLRFLSEPGVNDVINDVINDDEYSESFESDVEEERSEVAKTGTGLLNTSGAGELAALQQVLQAAHLESTGDSARPLGMFYARPPPPGIF